MRITSRRMRPGRRCARGPRSMPAPSSRAASCRRAPTSASTRRGSRRCAPSSVRPPRRRLGARHRPGAPRPSRVSGSRLRRPPGRPSSPRRGCRVGLRPPAAPRAPVHRGPPPVAGMRRPPATAPRSRRRTGPRSSAGARPIALRSPGPASRARRPRQRRRRTRARTALLLLHSGSSGLARVVGAGETGLSRPVVGLPRPGGVSAAGRVFPGPRALRWARYGPTGRPRPAS